MQRGQNIRGSTVRLILAGDPDDHEFTVLRTVVLERVGFVNAGSVIYNAPIVAFGVEANDINFPSGGVDYSKVHDQVLAIDPVNMTVTLNLINGFSFGRPVWYVSMDASIPLAAAIEHATFAPLIQNILLGKDDSFSSPIERIFISTNGPEAGGCNNPLRQGLSADLADGARPNNVLGGIPTIATDYSPIWDAQLFQWTQDAITQGFRGQVREEFQILTFVQDGLITGPGGKFGSSGCSINCPIPSGSTDSRCLLHVSLPAASAARERGGRPLSEA